MTQGVRVKTTDTVLYTRTNPISGNFGINVMKTQKQHLQILEVRPTKEGNETVVRG